VSWILLGIPVGIVVLYFGAEWLVDGAKKLAIRLGISPFVVGLTVVAMGLVAPEVATSLISTNNPQIIIGHIVGSNIANIGLAIGIAALIYPVVCKYSDIKFDAFFMVAALLIVTVMAFTGSLGVIEGAILLTAMVVFIVHAYRHKRDNVPKDDKAEVAEVEESKETSMWKCALLIMAGILFLFIGVTAFIDGAIDLATMIGMPELMTGLVIVAFGVCLPELCVCIAAARRHENEILVSNIVGSVVFNCFFALGIGVLYTAVPVTYYTMTFHLPVMIMMAVLLILFIRGGNKIARWQGAVFIGIYVVNISLMIIFPELTEGLVYEQDAGLIFI
jgi:cation:H+ antiporter